MVGGALYNQRAYGSAGTNTIATPPRIKCNQCNVVKNTAAFSKRQLGELAQKMGTSRSFNPVTSSYIPCTSCTPQQLHELRCFMCDEHKSRDKFSKQQLKKDDAVCWTCRQDIDNMDADIKDEDAADDSNDDDDDDDSGSGNDEFTLPSDTASMSHGKTYSSYSGGGVTIGGPSTSGIESSTSGYTTPGRALSTTNASSAITTRASRENAAFNPKKYAGQSGKNSSGPSGQFAKVKSTNRRVAYDVPARERRGQAASDDEDVCLSDSD